MRILTDGINEHFIRQQKILIENIFSLGLKKYLLIFYKPSKLELLDVSHV